MFHPAARRGLVVAMAALVVATYTKAQPAPTAETPKVPVPAATAGAMLSDSERTAIRSEVARQLRELADTLKLTQEQRDRARPILLDQGYKLRQVRDKYLKMERNAANREAMTKEVQGMRDATDVKLAAVLNPDQLQRYKAWRDAGLAKLRARMPAQAPAPAAPAADTAAKK